MRQDMSLILSLNVVSVEKNALKIMGGTVNRRYESVYPRFHSSMVIMRSALLSVTNSGLLTDVSMYHAKMRMSRMVGKQTIAAIPSDAIMSNMTTTTLS
jgi:hypothetical protein